MKILYTSYYNNKKIKNNSNRVSISISSPDDFNGVYISELAPDVKTFSKYKNGLINICEFTDKYIEKVTPYLNMLHALDDKAILLCWEKPNEFCHRHILAKLVNDRQMGIKIYEIK